MRTPARSLIPSVVIFTLAILLAMPAPVAAQAPGYAEITSPRPDQVLSGLVTITGTASHPSFLAYDLAFGYDPNPTDTWFPIGEPVPTPVEDGRLAIWDTSGISDGIYSLRLRVHLENGRTLVAVLHGLRVGSRPPPQETPSPSPPPTALAALARPTNTPILVAEADKATPADGNVLRALGLGAASALGLLGLLGLYAVVRPGLRLRWGSLRMRQLYWRAERRERRSRRRR